MNLKESKNDSVKLTDFAEQCGCAAKIPVLKLKDILKIMPKLKDKNILVDAETFDDAGVYKITNDKALVQTIDYFPPIVDDPYTYGQIAAANSLSDVYAMGGIPITALALICFPSNTLPVKILRDILKGGYDKCKEAGIPILGGHTIEDIQPKYGLAVTGIINPDRIISNAGSKPGDLLILTKPIGTGITILAIKGKQTIQKEIDEVIISMTSLNKDSSILMTGHCANACTDITGYGLLGHCLNISRASKVNIELYIDKIPFFTSALKYARMGFLPKATYSNRYYGKRFIDFSPEIPQHYQDILFDPQTSGGLLISISENKAEKLLSKLFKKGINKACIIGRVSKKGSGNIKVIQ